MSALEHDERCENLHTYPPYGQPEEMFCRCAERALAAARQREEEAKGEIARLKSEPKTPVEIHKKLGDMIIEEERLLDRLEELGDTTYAVSDEMVERTRKNISVIVDLNRERDALRAENDRLTLAASESARTLQVEILGLHGAYTLAARENGELKAKTMTLRALLVRYRAHADNDDQLEGVDADTDAALAAFPQDGA